MKLQHCSVSNNNFLNLIKSYLSDRIQKINFDVSISSGAHLLTGVPQGSMLGPMLLLTFKENLLM